MSARAKFRCIESASRYSHTVVEDGVERDVFTYRVRLLPVMGKSKTSGYACEENKQFFALTPSGQLEMDMVSEETARNFVPGQAYYIDFTPTEG